MERKLEITKKLEELKELNSDNFIAILNLPDARLCQRGCKGCITKGLEANLDERLSIDEIKNIIDYFAENYNTKFITINGRGDPFHPKLKKETIEKIRYAASKGIQSYIFTAGDNLDDKTCDILAENKANVMISLFGNRFIDADFFKGKKYDSLFEKKISENLRRLINIYKDQSKETRIGMNYVVREEDLQNIKRLKELKQAVNKNGISFICNTNFEPHPNAKIQKQLEEVSDKYSDFNLKHSTYVNGQCQMGAGSSTTVDYNGELYRCPYMSGIGNGKFTELNDKDRKKVLTNYIKDRDYVCVLRRTLK